VLFSALILFVLAAARFDVGRDYGLYGRAYVTISELKFFDWANLPDYYIGWLGLPFITFCKVISIFAGQNYVMYHAVIAFITVILLYKVILLSESASMSLFLYISFNLYYSTFNQSRQGIAILLVLYSYKYIKEKNLIKFLIIIALAVCFHFSAILAIIFYIIYNNSHKKVIAALSIIGACTLSFFWDIIISLISLTNYSIYLTGGQADKYNIAFSESTLLNLVYRCCLYVFCAIFIKRTVKKDGKNKGLYLICLILIPLQVLAVYSASFTRITTYAYGFYIFLIPAIYRAIEKKWDRQLYKIFVMVFFTIIHLYYYFAMVSKPDGSMIEYYQTFLGNYGGG
jgi:hypothetical protein